MSRKPTGAEVLANAKNLAARAEDAGDLRMALAVILPVEFGWSLEQVASLVGKSVSWVSRSRREIIAQDAATGCVKRSSHGGRRNQVMNPEEELPFMIEFCRELSAMRRYGPIKVVGVLLAEDCTLPLRFQVKAALEKRSGRPVSMATTHNIMRRTYLQKFGVSGRWQSEVWSGFLI